MKQVTLYAMRSRMIWVTCSFWCVSSRTAIYHVLYYFKNIDTMSTCIDVNGAPKKDTLKWSMYPMMHTHLIPYCSIISLVMTNYIVVGPRSSRVLYDKVL